MKRGRKSGWIVVMVLLWTGWGSVVQAETPAGSPEPVMGEVVVTASRENEEAAKVPASITVIDTEKIERSNAKNVPELLAESGLHVSDIGGNQRSYTVDLRGFGESAPTNLLVMVDGRRINQADLSGTDWTLIPLERIERIEVLPGTRGAVLYGDNASGGVVNIITKEGAGLEATVAGAYGSYDTRSGAAAVDGAAGIASFNLTTTYLESNGYRDNSDTRAKSAGGTVKLDPTEIISLNFSGGYNEDDTRLPGSILQSDYAAGVERTDTTHPNDYADTEDYYGKAGLELFFLTDDAFRLDVSYRNRDVTQYASFAEGWFTGDTGIETLSASPRFTFQESFGEVSNRLIFGADFGETEEDITNTSLFFGDLTVGEFTLKKRAAGYYASDDLGVTPNLTLSGGYRYDRARFEFSGTPVENTLDEEAATAGINYHLGRAKVYLSYGKSFRYPVLDEMFNFFDNSVNTALRPQTSRHIEAGTQLDLVEHLALTFNLFRIETDEEIFYNPVAFANENLDGDTLRNGLELKLNLLRNGWSAGAGYTYTSAEIEGGQYNNSKIPNVPENKAVANLGYTFGMGLFLGVDGIYTGTRYLISDFGNVSVKQDDYILVNAKVKYDWHWLTLFCNLNNIFDESYASYGGLNYLGEPGYYPSPEFNLLAGVSARFGQK
jgi:outer membrane receptor protein involved in Fe transport